MTEQASPLVVAGLSKRFGDVVALDHVDLSLNPGELLALVGPSGCGKSTLLRSIAGLVPLDSGTIRLGGELVEDGTHRLPPERRSIGLVFQEHALFPHLTVRGNIGFGVRDVTRRQLAERVDELLELVSLQSYGGRFPHELSGGERQRVALARALAPRPALMLFDEPFASLDRNLRMTLRHDVVEALEITHTPAIFVTHDQAEALAIGDRIAVLRSGRVLQVDEPAAVFHQPSNRFVAGFMGDASFLRVDRSGPSPATILGPVELNGAADHAAENAGVEAMVRPDDVRFSPSATGRGTVMGAEYHGAGWLVTIRHDIGEEVVCATSHLQPPTIGDRVELGLVPGHRQIVLPAER